MNKDFDMMLNILKDMSGDFESPDRQVNFEGSDSSSNILPRDRYSIVDHSVPNVVRAGIAGDFENLTIMEASRPNSARDTDYLLDIILPSILIAVLFVGNAIIVYVISQYRKRKTPEQLRNSAIGMQQSNSVTDQQQV